MLIGNKEEMLAKRTNLNFVRSYVDIVQFKLCSSKIEDYSWNTLGISIGGIF